MSVRPPSLFRRQMTIQANNNRQFDSALLSHRNKNKNGKSSKFVKLVTPSKRDSTATPMSRRQEIFTQSEKRSVSSHELQESAGDKEILSDHERTDE